MKLKLQDLLVARGLSQNQFAQRCGLKRQYIQRVAREHPTRISTLTLDRFCQVLDCQPEDLLERER